MNNYVGIMAGGAGTRFWPSSREENPKQFLDILGTGRSLLQMTYDRFLKICPKENIFIISNAKYDDLIKEQLPDITDHQILKEPARRNTAPCVAYAVSKIAQQDPDANIIISPADHLIVDTEQFVRVMERGLEEANEQDILVTVGIQPTRPDTGYGYIQIEGAVCSEDVCEPVKAKTFTEKPNLQIAQEFLKSGDFVWNSGMFIWNARSIKKSFQEFLPDMFELFQSDENPYFTDNEQDFINNAFSHCKNISIDYGIMEKAKNVVVIPASFEWSDLGTWKSVYDELDKDEQNNGVIGDNVVLRNADHNVVSTQNLDLVVLNEVDNLIVVESDGILLVSNRDKEQSIKQVLSDVKELKGEQFL